VAVAARNVSTSTADEARASSPFDRIAAGAAGFTSRAPFFVGCVLIVFVWAASFPLFPSTDTWQLVINSATTIVTFLLVALLQNTQRRSEAALQHKLDAIADGLADLMEYHLDHDDVDLHGDVEELKEAIGLPQVS
jgi:Low affinity iron permease